MFLDTAPTIVITARKGGEHPHQHLEQCIQELVRGPSSATGITTRSRHGRTRRGSCVMSSIQARPCTRQWGHGMAARPPRQVIVRALQGRIVAASLSRTVCHISPSSPSHGECVAPNDGVACCSFAQHAWRSRCGGSVSRFLECEATATRGAHRPGRMTVSTTEYGSEAAPERGCPPPNGNGARVGQALVRCCLGRRWVFFGHRPRCHGHRPRCHPYHHHQHHLQH